MEPEISIIVPIYKVEKYITYSLESLRRQSFTNWECILVDDGSPDNSGIIADNFSIQDDRFKVVHTQNQGVSAARNTALKLAKGKYISFVDPDDWVEDKYLETLYDLMIKYKADVVQCGFKREFTTNSRSKPLTDKEKVLGHQEAMMGLLSPYKIPSLLWNKLFRKKILTEDFPVGKTYEDAYIIPVWFRNVQKVVLSPEILYHYRMRKGSITKCGVALNHFDFVIACHNLGEMVNLEVPERFNDLEKEAYFYRVCIEGAKAIARNEADGELRRNTILKIKDIMNGIPFPSIRQSGIKIWFRSKLLTKHPAMFEKLMRVVNKADFHALYRRAHLFD